MNKSFVDILREPDSILFQYDDSPIRFEEPDSLEQRRETYEYKIQNGVGTFTLYPSGRAVKRIKLRWRGDMSSVISVLGDNVERNYDLSYGINNNSGWRSIEPDIDLPWYVHTYDGECLNCYGVKTGPNAFAFFRCDEDGITLWLDVRCGGVGVILEEPMQLVNVVSRMGIPGENPYRASREFCKIMCEKPVLPKIPIFGVNNWYWAYGNISHDIVMEDTDNLMELCRDAENPPYMVIDDGWQFLRYKNDADYYNGGPWNISNSAFPSMVETAQRIHDKGARAGLWFRPLLTMGQVPIEMVSSMQQSKHGVTLDPSHPAVLEMVENDVKCIVDYGFDLIKYDFTTFDTIGMGGYAKDDQRPFYDRSQTNCSILANLYRRIQSAAGDKDVIGCSTVNHLVAGIHAAQRSGHDTSGRNFEITRAAASGAMLRLPQNNTFFNVDPDCPAFTERVPIGANLDFLELCARTGVVTLASVTPGILKGDDLRRAQQIYKIASVGGTGAEPEDWLMHNAASKYRSADGGLFKMDWFGVYDGVRAFSTWLN